MGRTIRSASLLITLPASFESIASDRTSFAPASHAKAIAARERLADELVPVPVNGAAVVADECPLEDTSIEKLAALRPAFAPDGTVTAGNSSPLDDGAAAVILTSERYAANHGLTPTARFLGAAVAGCSLG